MVFFLIVVPCVSGSKDLQFLFFFKFNVPSCHQFAIFVEQLIPPSRVVVVVDASVAFFSTSIGRKKNKTTKLFRKKERGDSLKKEADWPQNG